MSVVTQDFVDTLSAWNKKTVPRHIYLQIDDIKEDACSNGLLEEDIHNLIKILVTRKLPNRCFLAVLRCCIPKTTVSKESVKLILSWVTSNFFGYSENVIVAILQWITCLLEFEVTEKQAVNDFYMVFFFFLRKLKLIPYACRIIHYLTKSDDVTRWSVGHVLDTAKKTHRLKLPALAVLNLFKSFKPECVPENIPPVSVSMAFRKIPEITQAYFIRAQQHNEAQQTPRGKELYWRTLPSTNRKKRKYSQELIPPIDYVILGPSMYQDKSTCSVLKFSSFSELCSYQLSLAMPSCLMSLLANHAGRHVIAYGNVQQQSRFSYLLFNKLYDALILKEPFPRDEIEDCLRYLVELEEYMQQGVPVVSKILSEYLIIWDGAEFQEFIFQLLQWLTTSSYTDIYNCVLHQLRNSFISMDDSQRCSLIRMFRKLVINMYVSTLYRVDKSFVEPFLACPQEWNVVETLEKTVSFVYEELIMLGFSQSFDDCIFLEEVVSFYETVLYLQEDYSLPLNITVPPAVVSHCVFGRHYFLISRVHRLLERYTFLFKMHLEKDDQEMWQEGQLKLHVSCKELNSALFGDVEFPETVIDAVANCEMYKNLSQSFRLNHHLAFSSHISMAYGADKLVLKRGAKQLPMSAVSTIFEDIRKLDEDGD